MSSPTIQAIMIFVRVVEANSFTGAARSLLIDPAAVSRAIKALETDLGVLLFARSTRILQLTAEGARFHRDCVQILEKYETATQRFRADRAMPHGRLTVGMAPALTRRRLLRALPAFQRQFPQIEIVLLGIDEEIAIGDKSIDVLLRGRSLRQRGGRHPEPLGLVVRKLFQSRFVVCASPAYLECNGVPREPTDLLRHECAAFLTMERDIQDEWQFLKSQTREKVKITPKLIAQGHDALREAGVAGCGIIRISISSIEDELRARKLVPVLADWECTGVQPFVAIYRKTRPMRPQVNAFVGYLKKAFQRYNLPAK